MIEEGTATDPFSSTKPKKMSRRIFIAIQVLNCLAKEGPSPKLRIGGSTICLEMFILLIEQWGKAEVYFIDSLPSVTNEYCWKEKVRGDRLVLCNNKSLVVHDERTKVVDIARGSVPQVNYIEFNPSVIDAEALLQALEVKIPDDIRMECPSGCCSYRSKMTESEENSSSFCCIS